MHSLCHISIVVQAPPGWENEEHEEAALVIVLHERDILDRIASAVREILHEQPATRDVGVTAEFVP